MASATVKNRSFLGAIAEVIKAICSLVISLANMGDEAVAMADQSVKVAREKQAIDLTIGMATYEADAVARAAMESRKLEEAMAEYVKAGGAERKQALEAHHDKLTALVQTELARVRASRVQ